MSFDHGSGPLALPKEELWLYGYRPHLILPIEAQSDDVIEVICGHGDYHWRIPVAALNTDWPEMIQSMYEHVKSAHQGNSGDIPLVSRQ